MMDTLTVTLRHPDCPAALTAAAQRGTVQLPDEGTEKEREREREGRCRPSPKSLQHLLQCHSPLP